MKERVARKANLQEALITFILLMVIMAVSIIVYGIDPHIPMFCGVIIAGIMGLHLGYKWADLEEAMIAGINPTPSLNSRRPKVILWVPEMLSMPIVLSSRPKTPIIRAFSMDPAAR